MSVTENMEDGMTAAFVGILILNIVFSGLLNKMISAIRSLQIITHLLMLSIIVPGNVNLVMSVLLPITQFDILDPDWTTDLVLEFDEPAHENSQYEIPDQTRDLGYETRNSMLNLGSIAIFLGGWFVKVIMYSTILVPITRFTTKLAKFRHVQRGKLFFNEFLALSSEAYLELLISAVFNYQMPLSSTLGEVISTYLGYVTFFITLVIIPGATVAILVQDKAYIVSEEFKFHYGVLTEGINHNSKIQLAFFGFFILRRFIFVYIVFQWLEYPTFQLQGVIFLNVFMVMYQAGVKPLEGRFNNRMETYNECLVYLISLHMMLYT